MLRAASLSLDLVPVMAMAVYDVASAKIVKRFDVWFVVHEA